MAGFSPLRLGEGQNGGSRGRSPLARGLGDVPPETENRGKLPTLANPPRVGPKAHEGGQMGGPRGAKPPWRGAWGESPHFQKRGEQLTPVTKQRVGPRTLANPKPTGVGKQGSRGQGPLAGSLGDVPPKTENRDKLPTLTNPPRVGPKAHEGGKTGGPGGRSPHGLKFGSLTT